MSLEVNGLRVLGGAWWAPHWEAPMLNQTAGAIVAAH
jgi:hypothetical protein